MNKRRIDFSNASREIAFSLSESFSVLDCVNGGERGEEREREGRGS
jgi:hypothetical protein